MNKILYATMLIGMFAVLARDAGAFVKDHDRVPTPSMEDSLASHGPAREHHAGHGDAPTRAGMAASDAAVGQIQDIRVSFSIEAVDGLEAESVRDGGYADVFFRVTHADTGEPVSGLQLAGWVSLTDNLKEAESCEDRIRRYVQGLLGLHADIDLNKHFILVLNDDRTISVIDPLMGVGGITHLFDMIVLPDRGEDWAATPDGRFLFVTLPRIGRVAKVDLNTFQVLNHVEAGSTPVRIALHPEGRYLWVGNDGPYQSGVTVIDHEKMASAAFIETGPGHHEIAFSDDGRLAFATNSSGNTVTVIDAYRFEKVTDLPTGPNPIAVAFSSIGNAAYAVSESDGSITVVSAERRQVDRVISTAPGPIALSFAHGDRWGFISNFRQNRIDIIDALKGEVIHRIPVETQPHQVAFSHGYAYVRHLGTPEVALIKLSDIGGRGLPEIHKVAFGNKAPGEYRQTALAEAIAPSAHMAAVVAANPAEKILYHYMEGMMVPMGSYSTYGRIPRAVRLVDRSVREVGEGLYTSRIKIPRAGTYNVSLLVKSPRFIECYHFEAGPRALTASVDSTSMGFDIEYLDAEKPTTAEEPFRLRFRLTRTGDRQPVAGLRDVVVLATRMPGNRQTRQVAVPLAEAGHYEALLNFSLPGSHLIFVSVPSLKIDGNDLPYHVVKIGSSP
ncbi:MAG: YncE family protein [Desulfobacterales bacterium]